MPTILTIVAFGVSFIHQRFQLCPKLPHLFPVLQPLQIQEKNTAL